MSDDAGLNSPIVSVVPFLHVCPSLLFSLTLSSPSFFSYLENGQPVPRKKEKRKKKKQEAQQGENAKEENDKNEEENVTDIK